LHTASPWLATEYKGDAIQARTPRRSFAFDYAICATGSVPDLTRRRELASFVDKIALWRDRDRPPAEDRHEKLGLYPYLRPAL
jgi:hypothetical protein